MKRDANPTPRPSARRWVLLALLGTAALMVLAGCVQLGPRPDVRLKTPTLEMNGFTQATAQVIGSGDWELEVVPDNIAADGSIAVSPSQGNGDSTVTVTVDPTRMPRVDVGFRLKLTAKWRGPDIVVMSQYFTFSFPEVTGQAVGGPASSALGVAESAPDTLSTAAFEPSTDEALASAPVTTLMVGLGSEGLVLGQDGVVGAPLAAAKLAVASTLGNLGLAASTDSFDAARLTLVDVPTADAVRVAEALRATPGVRYVEFPRRLYPASTDPLRSQQWNLDLLGVEPMWGDAGGAGVTIAILDQGFLPSHPDLRDNVAGTYDAVRGGSDITVTRAACETHGTHVAGIAAAVANNGLGVAGVAPYARLLLVNLGDDATSDCTMSTTALVKALDYVANGGESLADVINMSLGGSGDLGNAVHDAIKAAAGLGISLVAAAGNDKYSCPDNFTTKPVSYPAAYPEVLAVAATGPDEQRACYSHMGSEMFIAAPGGTPAEMILSTIAIFDAQGRLAGPDYGTMSGTSMASPAVAGVIAMLRSADPGASAAQIADAIATTAVDKGTTGRDPEYGWGFINPAAAYNALIGTPPPPPAPVLDLMLRVPGYPDALLDADRKFTLIDALPGPLKIEVGSDDNGNGVLGESGEWYGEQTITVALGTSEPPLNLVNVVVTQVP